MTYYYEVLVRHIQTLGDRNYEVISEETLSIRSRVELDGKDVETCGKLWQHVINKLEPQFGTYVSIVDLDKLSGFEDIDAISCNGDPGRTK